MLLFVYLYAHLYNNCVAARSHTFFGAWLRPRTFCFQEVHTVDKIIEALYFSNIGSLNKAQSPKEQELLGFLERHKAALAKALDSDGNERLEKYTGCYDELLTEREIEVFKQGFKLGMCFALEGTDIQTE